MTREEFVALHGEEAWGKTVEPQIREYFDCLPTITEMASKRIIKNCHKSIMAVLHFFGLEATGLLDAKAQIEALRDRIRYCDRNHPADTPGDNISL